MAFPAVCVARSRGRDDCPRRDRWNTLQLVRADRRENRSRLSSSSQPMCSNMGSSRWPRVGRNSSGRSTRRHSTIPLHFHLQSDAILSHSGDSADQPAPDTLCVGSPIDNKCIGVGTQPSSSSSSFLQAVLGGPRAGPILVSRHYHRPQRHRSRLNRRHPRDRWRFTSSMWANLRVR